MTQTTLHDYYTEYEWTTEPFVKTVIFHIKDPTARKTKRLDAAISDAARIKAETARRIPSVPRRYWQTAKPKNSVWYQWAKSFDSHLSNKTVHENIQQVRESFDRWQKQNYEGGKPSATRFGESANCAFYYAQPRYPIHDERPYCSLPLAAGRGERELLPLPNTEYFREYIGGIHTDEYRLGRAKLVREDGQYSIHQSIRTEVEVIADPITHIGIDIGLTNLAVSGAVSADGKQGAELWSGSEAAEMRRRFEDRRRSAQEEGRSKQIRDEEQRYVEHICHNISREVVEWALEHDRPQLVLEDLTGIRKQFIRRKREHTPDERRALHSWPFRKLQDMIEYKATEVGVPVRYINPEYTSQKCNECGHTDSDNRERVHFSCLDCGYQVNADVNAAFNIADESLK